MEGERNQQTAKSSNISNRYQNRPRPHKNEEKVVSHKKKV